MILELNGYNINYNITGEAQQTVIILQGWGTTQAAYKVMVEALASKYRVVTLDLPGFGTSTEPKEPWGVDGFVDFFLEFTRALGITHATLIGHSFGARIIIKLASRTNTGFDIDKIVIVDGAGIQRKKSFKVRAKIRIFKITKWILNTRLMRFIYGSLIEEWMNLQGSADYRSSSPMMRQCMSKAVNEDLTPLLPNVSAETLLIWGDKDTATPIADGRLMEEKMANASLAVIPGTGHFSYAENPKAFELIINSFL